MRFTKRAIRGAVALAVLAAGLAAPAAAEPAGPDLPDAVVLVESAGEHQIVVVDGDTVERSEPGDTLRLEDGSQAEIVAIGPDGPVQGAVDDVQGATVNDTLRSSQYALDRLAIEAAWPRGDGRGVVLAVIDSGVRTTHKAFAGSVLAGADCIVDSQDPCVAGGGNRAEHWHGTHVAGIAAARADDGFGTAGVSPEVTVLPIRVLDATNSGSLSDVARGVLWAMDHGADVINLSIQAQADSAPLRSAIALAIAHDIVVVAAAGNLAATGNPVVYPAAYPGVIGVASVDANDLRSSSSGTGGFVDIAAPGVSILAPDGTNDTDHRFQSGTSMATPHVAAVAAIIRQARPSLSAAAVADALLATADDLGPVGRDDGYGFGLLDPAGALDRAGATRPTSPRMLKDARSGRHVVLSWGAPAGYVDHFVVRRDGVTVTTLPSSERTWEDPTTPDPGQHTYEVSAGNRWATAVPVAVVVEVIDAAAGPGVDARPRTGAVDLAWTGIPGAVVTGWTISRDGDVLADLPADRRSWTDTDPVRNVTHDYEVVARLGPAASQPGGASARALFPATAPSGPLLVRRAGAGAATFTWRAPADDGSSPVTGYEALVSGPGQTGAARVTSGPSITLDAVLPGHFYAFEIRARNGAGLGPPLRQTVATATRAGYWLADEGGTLTAFGDAPARPSVTLARDEHVVALTSDTDDGLWVLTDSGRVVAVGAPVLGDLEGRLAAGERAATLAAPPDGRGYWIVTDRGRVVPFGAVTGHGDLTALTLNGPIIAAAATPSGEGYWLVGDDGGVFSFGDAGFFGSMGGVPLNGRVVGLAPTPTNRGYRLVAEDGGVFAFGDGSFQGSMGGRPLNRPVTGMVSVGDGYLLVAEDGGVFAFAAAFTGSLGGTPPERPVRTLAPLRG